MGDQVGGNKVGGDKVFGDKITYNGVPKHTPVPRQVPPRPHPYIPRPDFEQRLRKALGTINEKPLVLLSGFSGSGKSTLAAGESVWLYWCPCPLAYM